MRKYIFLLLIAMIWSACKKTSNTHAAVRALSGVYVEVIPDDPGTRLDFVDSSTVIVSGQKLSAQPSLLLGTNKYHMENDELIFYSDSANIKDTTTIWFKTSGTDTLQLSNCPFGANCMLMTYYYTFKKQ